MSDKGCSSLPSSTTACLLYSEQVVDKGVFTNKQHVVAYGPPEFQQEMAGRMADGEFSLRMLIDSSMRIAS